MGTLRIECNSGEPVYLIYKKMSDDGYIVTHATYLDSSKIIETASHNFEVISSSRLGKLEKDYYNSLPDIDIFKLWTYINGKKAKELKGKEK